MTGTANATILLLAQEDSEGPKILQMLKQCGFFSTFLHARNPEEAKGFLTQGPVDLIFFVLAGLEDRCLHFFETKHRILNSYDTPTLLFGDPKDLRSTELFRYDFDLLYPPVDRLELLTRLHMQLKIRSIQKSLDVSRSTLGKRAGVDPLTLLHNRSHLTSLAESEVGRSRRTSRCCSLLLLDLDHFSRFNAEEGYEQGNRLLKAVGRMIREDLRLYDYAARFENDAFALLLPETPVEGVWRVAERVRSRLHDFSALFGDAGKLSACQGIATSTGRRSDTGLDLVFQAEAALKQAMANGTDWITSDTG